MAERKARRFRLLGIRNRQRRSVYPVLCPTFYARRTAETANYLAAE